MTVVVAPVDDPRFRYAVACAIDRIASALGLRPDEVRPSPWFASRLEDELHGHGHVRVAADGTLVVERIRDDGPPTDGSPATEARSRPTSF